MHDITFENRENKLNIEITPNEIRLAAVAAAVTT